MDFLDSIEWFSVILNLAFVLLLIKEKKIAWPFGILGSLLSVYLFIATQLYSEAILYLYYVFMGFYGWYVWSRAIEGILPIGRWNITKHLFAVLVAVIATGALGYFFDTKTDAAMPYADAFSTAFSFLATYMEAKKIISTWYFWIILNTFSVWLYWSRGLEVYALLMIVYAVLSVVGLLAWRKSLETQSAG
jgi:nicotinamide mononucleotide transporter